MKERGSILAGILAVSIPLVLAATCASELQAQAESVPKFEVASARASPAGGSIFESIQSLGLRLEKYKAAIETLVIEHIEKTPTEN